MKPPVAASIAAAVLICVVSAVAAGGQVVDNGKVVADPQLDYRKYSKEIAASEKADQSRQAQAISAERQSVGEDEASFQASLAAVARSLNAGGPPDDAASAEAEPVAPDTPHGLPMGALVALIAVVTVGVVLGAVVLSSLLGKKKKSRRRPKEESVRLADFARKNDPGEKDR